MKHLIDRETLPHSSRLIGVNTSNNSVPVRPSSSSQPYQNSSSSSNRNSSSSSSHQYSQQVASQSRNNTFVKPADNKLAYNGRAGYSGQPPVKHDVNTLILTNLLSIPFKTLTMLFIFRFI